MSCRRLLVVLSILCLLVTPSAGLATGAPATATASIDSPEPLTPDRSPRAQQLSTPANNTTTTPQPRHRRPSELSEDGDLIAVEQYLTSRLGEDLQSSAQSLDQGQYERAKELLGEEYLRRLNQYAAIDAETDTNISSAQFRETRETQRTVVNETQTYQQTYRQYQQARRAGNETKARQLARKLNRTAAELNRSSQRLSNQYRDLEETTNQSFNTEQQQIEEVTQAVTQQQAQVQEVRFVQTSLEITAATEAVSFTNPLQLTGVLRTNNGSAVGNQSITLRVGARQYQTTTNASGGFALSYRPVGIATTASSLRIAYVPALTSRYESAETSVPVTVSSTQPTLTVRTVEERATAGGTVTVTGTVMVAQTPVPDVSVQLASSGTRGIETRTGANGTFRATVPVTATQPAGERVVTAFVGAEETALTARTATTRIQVTPRPTTLNASATVQRNRTVAITGSFRTTDGTPIRNTPIIVSIAGEQLLTAQTDSAGMFDMNVTVPESAIGADGTATLSIQAPVSESAYEASQTTATVALTPPTTGGLPWTALLLTGALGLVVVGVLLGREWEYPLGAGTAKANDTTAGAAETSSPSAQAAEPLAEARRCLDANETDTAILLAYGAVRRALEAPSELTHWELYQILVADDTGDAADIETLSTATPVLTNGHGARLHRVGAAESEALARMTRAYERAAFDPNSVDPELGAEVLHDADHLLDTVTPTADAELRAT